MLLADIKGVLADERMLVTVKRVRFVINFKWISQINDSYRFTEPAKCMLIIFFDVS